MVSVTLYLSQSNWNIEFCSFGCCSGIRWLLWWNSYMYICSYGSKQMTFFAPTGSKNVLCLTVLVRIVVSGSGGSVQTVGIRRFTGMISSFLFRLSESESEPESACTTRFAPTGADSRNRSRNLNLLALYAYPYEWQRCGQLHTKGVISFTSDNLIAYSDCYNINTKLNHVVNYS